MAEPEERLTIVMVADVPGRGIDAFERYERRVLPLLDRHGGRLERRLRTVDSRGEVHIVSFDTRASYDSYMADPERMEQRELIAGLRIDQRVLEVHDVVDHRTVNG